MGVVLSMIRHFQQLFDVPSLGGVYVAMTTVYRQFNEAHTAYRQLTALMSTSLCNYMYQNSLRAILMKYPVLYYSLCSFTIHTDFVIDRPGCPWQQLVYLIERAIECKEKNLYIQLCDEYGDLNTEQLVVPFIIIDL